MTSANERIMVAFEGPGVGEGELSWGQKENWATITALHDWFPLGGVTQLPADMTVERIHDTLRYAMARYPSLRTRLRFEEGRPIQVVHASGQLQVELVDAGETDPAKVAEALAEHYRETELDFTAEWPLRMAAILSRGRPTHMVGLISHLAADAAGLGVMMREMATMDAAAVTGMPPLAQAAWQQSPAGRRHNAAALRHWEGVLRTIGPNRFDGSAADGSAPHGTAPGGTRPRYWHGEFDSPALLPAVRSITAASGQGTSTVFLTLLAVALHEVNGINPVVIRPIVGNRFRPGLADVVCTVAQAGICVLDVVGVPFDVALQRAQRSVISAYKYAYFDHGDMTALRARIERERGVTLDTGLFLNDRTDIGAAQAAERAAGRAATAPRKRPDGVDGPAPSAFRWVSGQDAPYERLFVEVDDIPGGIRISLHLDSQAISLPDAERLTRAMEAIATRAASR